MWVLVHHQIMIVVMVSELLNLLLTWIFLSLGPVFLVLILVKRKGKNINIKPVGRRERQEFKAPTGLY
jgi:hypothetical protein